MNKLRKISCQNVLRYMEAVLITSDGMKLEEVGVSKAVRPGQPNGSPQHYGSSLHSLSTKHRVPKLSTFTLAAVVPVKLRARLRSAFVPSLLFSHSYQLDGPAYELNPIVFCIGSLGFYSTTPVLSRLLNSSRAQDKV